MRSGMELLTVCLGEDPAAVRSTHLAATCCSAGVRRSASRAVLPPSLRPGRCVVVPAWLGSVSRSSPLIGTRARLIVDRTGLDVEVGPDQPQCLASATAGHGCRSAIGGRGDHPFTLSKKPSSCPQTRRQAPVCSDEALRRFSEARRTRAVERCCRTRRPHSDSAPKTRLSARSSRDVKRLLSRLTCAVIAARA